MLPTNHPPEARPEAPLDPVRDAADAVRNAANLAAAMLTELRASDIWQIIIQQRAHGCP
jgi:hypothetical protein